MSASDSLSEDEKHKLDRDGYLVLEGYATRQLLELLRRCIAELFEGLGELAGAEFKQEPQTDRLSNLVDYHEIFRQVITMPKLIKCVEHIIGPDFKLGSLNARSVRPHSDWAQPLHCDMGALPDENGYSVSNIIWILKPTRIANPSRGREHLEGTWLFHGFILNGTLRPPVPAEGRGLRFNYSFRPRMARPG